MSILTIILSIFGASQLYWAWRGLSLARRRILNPRRRWTVIGCVLILYIGMLVYNFGFFGRRGTPVHLTLSEALLAAPFLCWAASSLVGAMIALLFAIPQSIVGLARWAAARWPRKEIESPDRRIFLQRTATLATVAPFFAGAYGLLYGRLNLETTVQHTRLANLPRPFEGFRICQLSDIHIGPFMPAEQIRKYADIANALKPDMVVLTGDFVTFDGNTQEAVVEALSGLHAPFGVFGCLGNHDSWSGVEASITALFSSSSSEQVE